MNYTITIWDDRYLQASVVLILSTFGLIANFTIIYTKLVTTKRTVYALVLSSFVFLLPNFTVYLPCAIVGCQFYSPLWLNLLTTPDTIGYYTYQLSLIHLSVERVFVFFSDRMAIKVQKCLVPIITGIWIFVFTLTLIEWFFDCRKSFNTQDLYLYFDAQGTGVVFLNIHKGISYCAPASMILCYTAVFIRLRIMHLNMSPKKIWWELFLVLQYLFICICSWLASFCFFFLPQLQELFQSNLSLLPTVVSILSLTSHAYIFLLANERLRRRIIHFVMRLCRFKMVSPVTAITTMVPMQKSSVAIQTQL